MTAIEQASKMTVAQNFQKPEQLKSQIDRIKRALDGMLGCEEVSASRAETQLHALEKMLSCVEGRRENAFPILDKQVLTWRNDVANLVKRWWRKDKAKGTELPATITPRLALVSLDSPTMEFYAEAWWRRGRTTKMRSPSHVPDSVKRLYDDVAVALAKSAEAETEKIGTGVHCEKTLSWTFTGIVPDRVKETIRREAGNFKDIFMLCEAPEWNMKTETRIDDPLLLGWDGIEFYILDRFDPTTLEQYISDEFAAKP